MFIAPIRLKSNFGFRLGFINFVCVVQLRHILRTFINKYVLYSYFRWCMKLFIKLGVLIFTFFGINAYAEGNCPQGYYPVYNNNGGGGQVGCAPMSGGNGGGHQGGGYNNPQKPKSYWADSYGAIAVGKNEKGENVLSYNKQISSQELADDTIFFLCKTLKYTDCKIQIRFRNSHAIIVKDENGMFYFGANENRDKAAEEAINECKSNKSKNCEFVGSLDSTARYIRY